jgi:hypothetical protein
MVPWSRNRGLFLEFRAALLAGICSPVRPRSTVGPLGVTRNTFHVIQANHSAPRLLRTASVCLRPLIFHPS